MPAAAAEPVRVFAAASLTEALDEALPLCTERTSVEAVGVYAGSGTLARQIAAGAPADLYISANPEWMDWLSARALIMEESRRTLLANRLVLIATPEAADAMTRVRKPFPALLEEKRLAVADVETVPAGIYARRALHARGWWDTAETGLVQSGNVREALTWVVRSETGFGIVYHSDALGEPRVTVVLTFDEDDHGPIRYPSAIILGAATSNAQTFMDCLRSGDTLDVFKAHGLLGLPG